MRREKEEERRSTPTASQQAGQIGHTRPSPYDPEGSYTGRPADPSERPVQDADDL